MFMRRVRRRMASAITSSGEALWGTFTVYFCRSPFDDTTQMQMISCPDISASENTTYVKECNMNILCYLPHSDICNRRLNTSALLNIILAVNITLRYKHALFIITLIGLSVYADNIFIINFST